MKGAVYMKLTRDTEFEKGTYYLFTFKTGTDISQCVTGGTHTNAEFKELKELSENREEWSIGDIDTWLGNVSVEVITPQSHPEEFI